MTKTNKGLIASYLLKQQAFFKRSVLLFAVLCCTHFNVFSQTYLISTAKYASGDINNNTSCQPGAKCGKYTAGMSITGSLTFNQFLAPNLNRASATIVDYRLNDGLNTFTPQNSYIDRPVAVTTNANGDLISIETLFRQWQDPTKTTTGSYLNEIWLLPDYSYVYNAVRCADQGSPGSCYQAHYGIDYSSYINLKPNYLPTFKSTNPDLSGITVIAAATGASSAAPNFSANQLSYSVTVPYQMSQIKIRPTAVQGSATIFINGTPVTTGTDSGIFNLSTGSNTFTITVTAQDGLTKKSYTLTVVRSNPSTNADLSALSINASTLNQTFAAQTTSYTSTVPYSQSTIQLSATKAETYASITLNGVAIASGTLSSALPLKVGQNVFQVVVTAEDGSTKKTYTLTITRQNPATNAILDFLSLVPDAALTPSFIPSTYSYSLSVPFSTSKIKFVPTSQDPNATVTVKGITVARGVASSDINLGQGNNIIPVVVTAEDGITKLTYTVTITRAAPSTDADLADLSVNGGTFIQTFSPSTTSYTQTLPFSASYATLGIKTSDANATVTINGRASTNSGISAPIALNVGSNTIQIRVVAENGTTVKTTTVTLTRSNPSTDPSLSQLVINNGTLSGPVIESGIYKYTSTNVLFAVTSVIVTPTATDGTKTLISVNGTNVVSGSASNAIGLIVGVNTIKIISTAENGTKREHWITITRSQPSAVNDLQSLTLSSGTLSPTFSSSQLEYTATVADNVSSLSLVPVLVDATASIRINGVASANNTSRSVNLSFGVNEIFIAVRAENGATKTYKLTITRSLSANANLSGLLLSAGTLSPAFATNTTSYTASVDFAVSTLTLTPQKSNEYASVTINNDPVASTKNISLNTGVNTITIVVRAQDGSTTKTYTLQVTRNAASNVSSLASLSVSSGTVASFSASTLTYNVTALTSTIKVTATPTNAYATLKVNGKTTEKAVASALIPLISGVAVAVPVEVTAQDGVTKTTYTLQVTFIPPACSPIETTVTEGGKSYKVLTFSTVGDCQWQAPAGVTKIDYLVVGAGGGTAGSTAGNSAWGNFIGGGGAGGGGVLSAQSYTITPRQSYNIKVGAGGVGGTKSDNALLRIASNGGESQFGSIVAKGGGAGGGLSERGLSGATGGGGGGKSFTFGGSAIAGQGFSGGISSLNTDLLFPNKAAGGGGGGAGAAGSSADGPKKAGNGGRGILSTITGSSVYYGGGGGGGARDFQCAGGFLFLSRVDCDVTLGQGGQGGGAAGKQSGNGNNGTNGLGGGAGGVGGDGNGGRGGDGIVIVRYELSPCLPTETTIVGTKNGDGTFTQNQNGTVYKVLTYTSLGTCSTWTPPYGVTEVDYLVVGGGGSGGTPGLMYYKNNIFSADEWCCDTRWGTGGGGAGGFREGTLSLTQNSQYLITVGAGGTSPAYNNNYSSSGNNGSSSQFGNIVSAGGGGGGGGTDANGGIGKNGGSGGGGGGKESKSGGTGNTPSASPSQGNGGGASRTGPVDDRTAGGGGGGAGSTGVTPANSTSVAGAGGAGKASYITGTLVNYAGGGGGGAFDRYGGAAFGSGGVGGGGAGSIQGAPGNGTNGLGGGGGGRGADGPGGDGGSGVVIIRYAVSTDANLTGLTVGEGTLSPVFASNTTTYSITVPNATNTLTITPTTSHPDALISINGEGTDSGKPSRAFDVEVGDNTFSVVVTAPDGRTRKTYTINVKRISANANLTDLYTSEGAITPSFQADNLRYDVPVSGTITSVKVAARTQDPNATIKINGAAVLNGQYSNAINLPNFGANNISVEVTAEDGVTTKTYTVVVSRVSVALTSLTNSAGQMQETFDVSRKTYTQTVPNAVKSLSVLPVALDPNAVIRINGQLVRSGVNSSLFDLEVGSNKLTVDVIAVDGSASDKYSLVVTRGAPNTEARLQNLVLNVGSLNQTFDADTKAYTMSVPFAADTTLVTATAMDPNATISINGVPVQTGVASPVIRLAQGSNTVRVDVTAQNGIVQESYIVTITRGAPTSEDRLSGLTVTNATISPAFGENTFSYTSSVSFNTSSVRLTAVAKDVNATIRINGELLKSGVASEPISLIQGSNTIQVEVFGQDGSNANSAYTLTITRGAPSTDASLSGIALSQGSISPTFASNTLSYTSTVPFVVESLTITATTTNANAKLSINGETVSSGQASSLLGLVAGSSTTYTVQVTAEDGTTTRSYSVAISRTAATSDELLSNLTHTAGSLVETFASSTYLYTSTVPFATTSTRINPVLRDTKAQVRVNGSVVVSGQNSDVLTLAQGLNEFKIETLSEDKANAKEYILRITRSAPSANADLSGLALSAGTLSPAFSSATTSYTSSVGNAVTSITVSPTVSDLTASVTVNGTTVNSGQASGAIALAVGSNTISVVVTAQNGTTTQSYTLTVTRAASANANLSDLVLSSGVLSPVFNASTTSYTSNAANSANSLTVVPTVADANATVTVNGTATTNGQASGAIALNVGSNTITVVVTAQDGSTTKTYTITVNRAPSSDADLSGLSLSAGTLSPSFSSSTTSYTASVANTVTSLTVTPTVADATATVTVNGTATTNGQASGSIALAVGSNTITVVATAQDGTTTKSYTITVTRAPSSDADLSGLSLSAGTLSPSFSSSTTSYTASVANTVTNLTVTPTVADANATVTVNGTATTSGQASVSIALAVGSNTITVVATAQDGTTTKTYTITVTRAASSNADLSGLSLSAGTLSPAFGSSTTSYTASVANTVTSLTVTPTVADATATVKVNGVTVISSQASGSIALNVGSNIITIVATAQDGTTTKTYTITVTRAASSNADLSGLSLSAGTLSPSFSSSTTSYTDIVSNTVTSLTITPTVADATATVKVNGVTVTSGQASGSIALNVGSNTITVVTTAQDGTTTKTYTVVVTRSSQVFSSDANLSGLSLSAGTLSPAFSSSTTSYTASVANTVTSLTVAPTVADAYATVTVNGITVTSGQASGSIALAVGSNSITVVATAQDGTTTKTYTITVTRAGSSNADLNGLTLSTGILSPAFGSSTTSYTASVSNTVTSLTITPTVADATATVKVNGVTVTSGQASGSIALAIGSNTITVVVTAQNGTTKTYTTTITRAPKQLTIGAPTLTLVKDFDGNTSASVTPGNLIGVEGSDVVFVSAVANYNNAAVGTNKTITVVYSLTGPQASNYIKPVDYVVGNGEIKAITPTNTPPTNIEISSLYINENNATESIVGTLTATDADAGDTFTFSLVSGLNDNASFTITGNTLKTAAVFDYELKSSYTIRVKVVDAGGLSYEKTFTINVNNLDSEDTDGDGILDSVEKGPNPSNPRDTDSDGIPDYKDTDSDGDGVPDLTERIVGTSPINRADFKDSDRDGIPDYVEIIDGSDPNDPKDSKDSDGDGVPDYIEIRDGTNPNDGSSFKDTDGKGVPDYVRTIVFPLFGINPPDPSAPIVDSDGDGISDYEEIKAGTNPNDAPANLNYSPSTLIAEKGKAITPITPRVENGKPISYAISPELPSGLSLDSKTGVISGAPNVLVLPAVNYTITATNRGGSVRANFTLVVNDIPPSALTYTPGSQLSEQGKAIIPMVASSIGGAVVRYSISPVLPTGLTFNTSTGEISGTRTQGLTGTVNYTITATNSGGSTSATVTLNYNTAPTDISTSIANIYEGNSVGEVVGVLSTTDVDNPDSHAYSLVTDGASDLDNKFFTISGNRLLANYVFNFAIRSAYTIRIRSTDSKGLFVEKNFIITISKRPEIFGTTSEAYIQSNFSGTNNLSTKPIVSKGYSSQLSIVGSDIRSVSWSSGTGLSSTTSLNPIFKYGSTVTYSVTITSVYGSVVVIPFTVEVRDDYFVKASNILTVRQDGINDYFVVENIQNYPDNELTIYDRNGKILTKMANYNNRWDGKINGKPLSTDTYFYVIRFASNPKAIVKGFITLINN